MTRDLGVWTAPDCALVLIDYQEEMLSSILSGLHREQRDPRGARGRAVGPRDA